MAFKKKILQKFSSTDSFFTYQDVIIEWMLFQARTTTHAAHSKIRAKGSQEVKADMLPRYKDCCGISYKKCLMPAVGVMKIQRYKEG